MHNERNPRFKYNKANNEYLEATSEGTNFINCLYIHLDIFNKTNGN